MKSVVVVSLSKHFLRRWKERVGARPSLDGVNQILRGSVKIRRQERLLRQVQGRLVWRKILAEYWNHRAGIIVLVDEDVHRAVTVMTTQRGVSL